MDEIKVFLVTPWWYNPYFIALFSSFFTGLFFAFVLHYYNSLIEKRDVIIALTSELSEDYNSLKKIQDLSKVEHIESYDGMINAYINTFPSKKKLSKEDIVLEILKNMSMDQELSIECWIKLQSQLAKYSKDFSKYNEIYSILRRIIRYSKIKSGEIETINNAEKFAINQLSAIRTNSMDFIKYYEDNF